MCTRTRLFLNAIKERELIMTLGDIELGRCTVNCTVVHQLQHYWVVDGKLENIYKHNFIQLIWGALEILFWKMVSSVFISITFYFY